MKKDAKYYYERSTDGASSIRDWARTACEIGDPTDAKVIAAKQWFINKGLKVPPSCR